MDNLISTDAKDNEINKYRKLSEDLQKEVAYLKAEKEQLKSQIMRHLSDSTKTEALDSYYIKQLKTENKDLHKLRKALLAFENTYPENSREFKEIVKLKQMAYID